MLEELMLILRILIAAVLGFAVGFERKIRYKEAGIRTHAIVSMGSCLMMLISKYGFSDIGADGARIAAQVVSGIGFLGAGIIMYRRDSLRGVTTAAGIWAIAGVGMAVGAGQYIIGVGTAALIIFIQWFTHLKIGIFKSKRFYIYRIKFSCSAEENENEKIKKLFGVSGFSRINFYTSDQKIFAAAEISTNHLLSDDEIKTIVFDNNFINSVERVYQSDGKDSI